MKILYTPPPVPQPPTARLPFGTIVENDGVIWRMWGDEYEKYWERYSGPIPPDAPRKIRLWPFGSYTERTES